MSYPDFTHVTIIGMGLMGGSLGKALVRNFDHITVTGIVRRDSAVNEVINHKAAHLCTTNLEEGLAQADCVVLATPVEVLCSYAGYMAPYLKPGCVVTDMGSTKEKIVAVMTNELPDSVHFVGSHPMAGSEKTSIEHATSTLFEKSLCIVTPDESINKAALDAVIGLWESVGCRIRQMSPSDHDRLVAAISHVPHLIASCLVNAAADMRTESCTALELASTGFIDTTRIASGSPVMWQDICTSNKKSIVELLASFETLVAGLRKMIEHDRSPELLDFLTRAKDIRDTTVAMKKVNEHE